MRDGFRPADQIALNPACFPRKESPLLLGLDASRDHGQSEGASQSRNGVDDGAGLKAVADPAMKVSGDEALIELDRALRPGD
jgi:hypothetical protein